MTGSVLFPTGVGGGAGWEVVVGAEVWMGAGRVPFGNVPSTWGL